MENEIRTADYLRRREEEIELVKKQIGELPAGEYILELGCGHGHFLTAYAEKFAEKLQKTYFIGVDKNPDRIERGQKKSDRLKLNIFWLNANVEDVLDFWPKNCKIVKIFVLFPDPWPKARHHKHRFVNEQFLQTLAKISEKGALFYFRSDHDGYFEAVNDLIKTQKVWTISDKENWPVGLPATVFEGHHPRYQSLIATLGD